MNRKFKLKSLDPISGLEIFDGIEDGRGQGGNPWRKAEDGGQRERYKGGTIM